MYYFIKSQWLCSKA